MFDKDNIKTFNTHVSFAGNYITSLQQSYYQAFMEVRGPELRENPFLIRKLDEARLPLRLHDEVSLIVDKKTWCLNPSNEQFKLPNSIEDLELDPGQALLQYLNKVSDRVLQLYKGIVDTLYAQLSRLPTRASCLHFIERYYIFSLLDILEEKYKYHSGHLVCSLLPGTTAPKEFLFEEEIPGVVVGGWVRRFFLSTKVSTDLKIQVAMGLQNAKRAAAAISADKQQKAIKDHQDSMTGKAYKEGPLSNRILGGVCLKIERLVQYYYPHDFEQHIPTWRLPSLGATVQSNRKKGGAMGFYSKLGKFSESEYVGNISTEHVSIPLMTAGFSISETKKIIEEYIMNTKYSSCNYHQILEPFKVRGITAADVHIQHYGRLIQKPLHSFLRDPNGPFRFIGKRHNVEDISNVYDGTVFYTGHCDDGLLRMVPDIRQFFVAGDYKSATDNMHPCLPEAFVLALSAHCGLSPLWEKVLQLTLGPHKINYEDVIDSLDYRTSLNEIHLEREILSSWGQLMGSPTSFPVLNLVNAAMFWYASEIYYRRDLSWNTVLKKFRPLFNGDDISFTSNSTHYKIWEEVCTNCGLSLSPGKNYVTTKFVNINSTCYGCTSYQVEDDYCVVSDFKEIFVLNSGLVKGQAKVQKDTRNPGEEEASLSSVCDQLQECVRCADEEIKARVFELFEYHMKDKLCKTRRSWRLPQIFGGLGLPFGNNDDGGHLELAFRQLNDYSDLSEAKDKFSFNQNGEQYLAMISKELVKRHNSIRHPLEEPLDIVKPRIVAGYAVEKEYYPLPSLSFCFSNFERKKTFSPDRKFNKKLTKVQREIKNGKWQSTLAQRMDLLLNPHIYKLSNGGSTIPLKVDVD